MKKLILLSLSLFLIQLAYGQSTMPRAAEWLDAETYTLAKRGEDKKLNHVKVNVKNGKEKAFEKEKPVTFTSLMPKGYSANGATSHISEDGNRIVFTHEDDLYTFAKSTKALRRLTAGPGTEKNARFSPDGNKVAFTRDHNLFVVDVNTGLEMQLTTDGSETIKNGWASWVYFEEILGRGSRYRAFYWSPNSQDIAFLRFDDATVPTFPIYHHEGEDMAHGYLEITSYPKSGDDNPLVSLAVADVESGKVNWIDKDEELEYLAMIIWTPDGSGMTYQQMDRDQSVINMYHYDVESAETKQLYTESQKTWVEWFEEITFLENSNGFLIRSNRDGWYNLYHYGMDGKLVNQLTKNNFRTTGIQEIDEENGKVYFQATGDNPVESHFFVVDMDGKNQQQLTKKAGTNRTKLSPDNQHFINTYSSYNNPGEMHVMRTNGEVVRELGKETRDGNVNAGLTVEFFTVPTTEGMEMPAYWVLPPNFDPNKKYPIIFEIYGGPDAGSVFNRYRDYSFNKLYKDGVIRFTVDHRSSGKFGKKGLDYMHRNLGKWEMHDYIEAVKWLRTKSFIDETKVGISGGSYGGYMSAMALTYASDYFTHGIARSSVMDWRLYDNVYTERYMDTPADNPEGYDAGSVMTYAKKLKGKLYIIHGTIDDNVHMQNSIQLISKLQDLGKDFEMMVYPGGRHGWGGAKGQHVRKLSDNFWREHFLGE